MGRRQRTKWQLTIDALVSEIEAEGYAVSFVEYVEDAETPGILGQAAGVTDRARQKVKVRRRLTPAQVVAVLAHELEHVRGADRGTDYPALGLACGGRRNVFGEEVPAWAAAPLR